MVEAISDMSKHAGVATFFSANVLVSCNDAFSCRDNFCHVARP